MEAEAEVVGVERAEAIVAVVFDRLDLGKERWAARGSLAPIAVLVAGPARDRILSLRRRETAVSSPLAPLPCLPLRMKMPFFCERLRKTMKGLIFSSFFLSS